LYLTAEDGEDVLALLAHYLVVGASAALGIAIQANCVAALATSRRYDPSITVTAYIGDFGEV
jgi:hypothetical protein